MHFFWKNVYSVLSIHFKETSEQRQCTEQEKIFASDMTDKGLIANIYKHAIQHSKAINPIKKQAWPPDSHCTCMHARSRLPTTSRVREGKHLLPSALAPAASAPALRCSQTPRKLHRLDCPRRTSRQQGFQHHRWRQRH